jgi:hypothetical protein
MIRLRNRSQACLLAGLLSSLCAIDSAADNSLTIEEQLDFRVFLNDKEIGYHSVQLRMTPQGAKVSVDASFEIKVLFFNAFSYRHSAEERWNGACLEEIRSETDYGGDQLFVRSEAASTGLKIINQSREIMLTGCIRSYAYWDLERLRASHLLNTQTGEYQRVAITDLGIKPLRIGSLNLMAKSYQLETEQGDITLWYGEDRKWLGLQTRIKGGRVLSYINGAANVDT